MLSQLVIVTEENLSTWETPASQPHMCAASLRGFYELWDCIYFIHTFSVNFKIIKDFKELSTLISTEEQR